jgi:hypothetical protein
VTAANNALPNGDADNEPKASERSVPVAPALSHETVDAGRDCGKPASEQGTKSELIVELSSRHRDALKSLVQTDVLRSIQPFHNLLKYRETVGREFAALASGGVFEVVDQLRKSLAATYQQPLLASVEALSRASFGNSMITGDIAAQLANIQVAQVLGAINNKQIAAMQAGVLAQIESIRTSAMLIETHSRLLTGLAPLVGVARPVVLATRAWQDVVRRTPQGEGGVNLQRYLQRLDVGGHMTGWAVHAGVVLTEPDGEELVRIEAEISTALAPGVASTELRQRLREIDLGLAEKLEGAWERITNGGPDSTSQAANSLMELIDWTLRLRAPNELVIAWHAKDKRPTDELYDGKPTRSLRIRYAVRHQPEKRSSLNMYVKTVQELTALIQGTKHTIDGGSRKALVPVAMVVEGLLYFLLVD